MWIASIAWLLIQRPVEIAPAVRVASSGASPAVRRAGIDVTSSPLTQNEAAIAFDPENPFHLVVGAQDYDGVVHVGVWHSFDGGKSWAGDRLENLNPELTQNFLQAHPAVAAGRGGVFYVSFNDYGSEQGPVNRLVVGRSDDGGVTWPGVCVIAENGGWAFEDKPYLAVDDSGGPFDGNVYVAWTHTPESPHVGRIWLARSTDRGATFGAPVPLSTGQGSNTGALPRIGPNGEVYVIWTNGSRLEGTVSTDGGATFVPDRTVTTAAWPLMLPGASFFVSPFGSLAVDRSDGPDRGTLYVVWADDIGVGHGPDVLLRRSTDGGATWDLPVRVSDDTNGAYQVYPSVAVGPDGAVNVVFVDQRDTPQSPLYHTYLARSTDGGRTFQRNIRLTSEASDSTLDGFSGTFIGDYIGIAASSLGVFPAWTDIRTSNGQAEIYVRPLRFGPR
jgi:hypothetical protein